MKKRLIPIFLLFLILAVLAIFAEDSFDISDPSKAYKTALAEQGNGNYKNAFEIYKKLLTKTVFKEAPEAFSNGILCLNALNRPDETDSFSENILAKNEKNPMVRLAVASFYLETTHYGYTTENIFYRGANYRQHGLFSYSSEYDRVKAIQILEGTKSFLPEDKIFQGQFYLKLANAYFWGRGNRKSWLLQNLTDFSKLPAFEKNYYSLQDQFAPVDKKNNPIVFKIPESLETSTNDGEKWRFYLEAAKKANPQLINQTEMQFASFLLSQWGTETLGYDWASKFDEKAEKSQYSLETLSDEETLCKLATGVERFKLPEGYNYIAIIKSVINSDNQDNQQQAVQLLGTIYENRRQYTKAAKIWQSAINKHWNDEYYNNKLNQIVGNWGQFENVEPQLANQPATFSFRYRNATEVSFTAYRIDMSALLYDLINILKADTKEYWRYSDLNNLGYKLVNENEKKFVKEEIASWKETLQPRPNHFDNLVKLKTPFQKPGAYLVKSKTTNGNENNIVIFLTDSIIIEKPMAQGDMIYVADALTGKPLSDLTVECFGYGIFWDRNKNQIKTKQFAEKSNELGLYINKTPENNMNWLYIARDDNGRFAFQGFNYFWYNNNSRHLLQENKTYALTDRPVYKPGQKVYYKAWNRLVSYEDDKYGDGNKESINIEIFSPLGNSIFIQTIREDDFGGINGQFELPMDATLGSYYMRVNYRNYVYFQVEEYKKPEYEVTIELPKEAAKLGDKIKAKIKANYFFGAPVTKAKVKYKVLRTEHEFNWYPSRHWDWLYGNGYGWLSYDCEWYPGWIEWGCKRPYYWWWYRPQPQPEVVMENEVDIGDDGVVDVQIDTKLAKEIYGDKNHQYQIIAEVVDASRRTIVGQGNILVTSHPFKIFSWLDKGYYNAGDLVQASFQSRTANGIGVKGSGKLTLLEVSYDKDLKSSEKSVQTFEINVNETGLAQFKFNAPKAGQYRLKFVLKNESGESEEGGILFNVYGDELQKKNLRFNDIELLVEKNEYKPGEKINLKINTNAEDSHVLMFLRAENGIYPEPEMFAIKNKTINKEIVVLQKDMPNFFIEAITVRNGKIHSTVREIIVPPEKKALNVEIMPNATNYKPGQESTIKVKVTDINAKPFVGSMAISIYDKAIEYISGGSNATNIKEFFWKWRRQHQTNGTSSLHIISSTTYLKGTKSMESIGIFGHLILAQEDRNESTIRSGLKGNLGSEKELSKLAESPAEFKKEYSFDAKMKDSNGGGNNEAPLPNKAPQIRKDFADLAYWNGNITTDSEGMAQIKFKLPESLTTWKINSWVVGAKTEVGYESKEIVTAKDILIRLQAPRFFVEKDEVVLSGIVHNYLKKEQKIKVIFQQIGDCISDPENPEVMITVEPNGEKRVDWRVKVLNPGETKIRMSAINEKESDAMEMKFPVLVHGMMKLESYAGIIKSEGSNGIVDFNIPAERKPEESELIINYSPTLAGAMVDALPYLVDYPYGCTEQTLNKFIPTVITQSILKKMGLNLENIKNKRTNLNADEIGNGQDRAKGWYKKSNPVFDIKEVENMIKTGLNRLYAMQNGDGGWGWFYDASHGQSYEHTTATVVNGFLIAKGCGVAILQNSLDRGVQWLQNNQEKRLREIKEKEENKAHDIDALVYKILTEAGKENKEMRNYLLRDKKGLSVYSLTLIGISLFKVDQFDLVRDLRENIDQYLEEDKDNQTAWLNLNGSYWWYWYGNDIEANAHYLMLLSLTNPNSAKASGLVKYLLSNRKNATYWRSTRDTAICIEAIAAYWKASGEMTPDMSVEVWLDGKLKNRVAINKENLFDFDGSFTLKGEAVTTGKHIVELRKVGRGNLYYNTYVSYFTKEDNITKAGLNLKSTRKIYRLIKDETKQLAPNKFGGIEEQNTDKYLRVNLENNATVKSGELLEVEITVETKNEYEYICIEDPKAAGFETVDVRSGYNGNSIGAYVEFKNEKVVMFARILGHGKYSISYKVRAEIPGKFSALPTKIYAMYAPELKGNSDENKINIID